MLLWQDNLDYKSTAFLAKHYTASNGFSVGSSGHPVSGRTMVQVTAGDLQWAVPTDVSSSLCCVGFLMTLTGLSSKQLLFFPISAGFAQVKVFLLPEGSKTRISFISGDEKNTYVTSSAFDLSKPTYVELVISCVTTGSVALRVNGIEDCRADFVNCAVANPAGGYSSAAFHAGGISGSLKLADLYVLDQRIGSGGVRFSQPLGPVYGTRKTPLRMLDDNWGPGWAFMFAGPPKIRLIVQAGQSNNNGRGLLPYPGAAPWRNPNPKILVWDTRVPAAFRPLEAGVNTCDFFLDINAQGDFWGPEMMFSELLAQLFERTGETGTPPVRLMKMCQDGSFIAPFPGSPQLSWSPTQPGSLYHLHISHINAAVSSLGGWGAIDSVDYLWYQGESESSFFESWGGVYLGYEKTFFDAIATDIPVPVRYHRVVVHKDIHKQFFPAVDGVRGQQVASGIPGYVLNVDDFKLAQDLIHFPPKGYDDIGRLYYDSWFKAQDYASFIDDYFANTTTEDNLYLARSAGGFSDFLVRPELQHSLINSPCLAVNARSLASYIGAPETLGVTVANKEILIPVNYNGPSLPAFGPQKGLLEAILAPDAVAQSPLRLRKV